MDDNREKFIRQLLAIANGKASPFLMTEEKYQNILVELKAAQENKKSKSRHEYRLLDRFGIITVGGTQSLVEQQGVPLLFNAALRLAVPWLAMNHFTFWPHFQ